MIRFFTPFLLFALFISESIYLQLAGDWFYESYIFSPKFILIALIFLAFYGAENYYLGYAVFFGLLTDVVYSEVIGVYLLSYPAICYIIHKLRVVIQGNYFMVILVSIFGIALIEIFSFVINTVVRISSLNMEDFLFVRLIPTLLFNLVFIILLMIPLRKLAEKLKLLIDK